MFGERETFDDYLVLRPHIPENIGKVGEGYFLQVKIPEPLKNLQSVVTEFFNYIIILIAN